MHPAGRPKRRQVGHDLGFLLRKLCQLGLDGWLVQIVRELNLLLKVKQTIGDSIADLGRVGKSGAGLQLPS
jgi:hypothetical protein